jgi:hypothetical protein
MIPVPLPIDPVGFDLATATDEQVRDMLGRCSDRRDLWDGVCVELEEALEARDDTGEERRRKGEREESGWRDEAVWRGDYDRHPEDDFE